LTGVQLSQGMHVTGFQILALTAGLTQTVPNCPPQVRLNIARIHNAVSTVGPWGRGLGISRTFARCRKVGQKPLHRTTSHVRTLTKIHAEYRANIPPAFFVFALLGVAGQSQHAVYQQTEIKPVKPTSIIPDLAKHRIYFGC
jgi:hypothetical protein